MKKLIALLLALAMVIGLVACGAKEEAAPEAEGKDTYHIGVLMKTLSASYWQTMAAGLQAEVDKMDDVTIEIFGAESEDDLTGQLNLMETMINSGKYDALCVAPITPTNLISGVVMANQAGLPVVDIDEKFDMAALAEAGGYVVGYATSDNIAVGATAADLIMEAFPDGAGVAIIEGIAGATSGELRRDGCKNAIDAAEGYSVLDVQPGDWDRQTALDVATNMITKYGDELKAIFCANDTMAKGALQAMENTGRTDIFLVSTDADSEVLGFIAEGKLVAVVQSPTGIAVSCVEQAVEACRTGNAGSVDVVPEDTLIPAKVCTQDNVSEF